jgi:large subunit ribosomal protein L24
MKPLVHRKAKRVRTKPVVRLKLHITKGDRVRVIRGDDKGAEGTVLRVFPKTGRVTVEGVNKIKRHTRPTATREGGIIEREAPVHHSNVMLLDGKGAPTRVRRRRDADGTVERIAVSTGQAIPRSR